MLDDCRFLQGQITTAYDNAIYLQFTAVDSWFFIWLDSRDFKLNPADKAILETFDLMPVSG